MNAEFFTPDWSPFWVAERGSKPVAPRAITTVLGVGDRLRAAAFAEIQAREAFLWAAAHFADAPQGLRDAWRALAREEEKHLGWLLARLEALGLELRERTVSDHLWVSFMRCETAQAFALYMANAEERGRQAGERFCAQLAEQDPVSAQIFGQIAREEVAHIELARRWFPAGAGAGAAPAGVAGAQA